MTLHRKLGFFECFLYVICGLLAAACCVFVVLVVMLVVAFLWPFILCKWLAMREFAKIPIDANESFDSRRDLEMAIHASAFMFALIPFAGWIWLIGIVLEGMVT